LHTDLGGQPVIGVASQVGIPSKLMLDRIQLDYVSILTIDDAAIIDVNFLVGFVDWNRFSLLCA
jgi:hypothetical protein